ncbi:MAG: preprotein translocase subunit YajC [Christensenellales bacterium]|jgi:preprotein translocase subunit YajC|nr:preprotein translocase subunit YajC [Clostridiales bacterium]
MGDNNWIMFAVLGGFFVIMILMTVIPNRKRKKQTNEMFASLTVGDKIMTVGGIIGTIVAIDSDTERYTINVGTAESESLMVIVKGAIRQRI